MHDRCMALPLGLVSLALLLAGCLGPPVLERQVLSYDEVAKSLDEKLLLLNIARLHHGESVHFTTTSSIAATFDWTTTAGAGGQLTQAAKSNFLDINIGASSSENPTFSILPITGEEFTKRIATPFPDSTFEFVVFQGTRIDQAMRIMAAGIEVQAEDGRFVRFIENDPRRPQEYEEFRRIASILQALNESRQLFVRALVFEDILVADLRAIPRAEDINNGFDKGLRWRQKADGGFELTRLEAGRVIVTNVDPMSLTDLERFQLNERIKRNPAGFVHLSLHPASGVALEGAIKLRSLMQILGFLALGIDLDEGYEVPPNPWLQETAPSPPFTLKINVTGSGPSGNVPSIEYRSKHYSVNDTRWDRQSFAILNVLFQTTVQAVQDASIPITIAK